MDLEVINKLYLELSQVATAKTERELDLENQLQQASSGPAITDRAIELYGPERVNAVHVANLLTWLRKTNLESFHRAFGSRGLEMLEQATSNLEVPLGTP